MSASQFRLLTQRRFLPFFLSQSFGAFNDNVLKNGLVIIVAFNPAAYPGMAPSLLTQIAGGLFILPYMLFSGLAGEIADRFEKASVIRTVKAVEILIMMIAGLGFYGGSLKLLLLALFLMGVHSTFYSPAKYGILPEILGRDELVGGNAMVEMGTFVAILLGQLLGGILAGLHELKIVVGALLALAVAGLTVSLFIPRRPASSPDLKIDWNPVSSSWRNLKAAASERSVFLCVLGISWFWFYGILVLAQVPIYGKDVLGGLESVVTGMLVAFSVGVGIGSLACEKLGQRRVEIGLVPFGSIGLTLFGVDLYFATPRQPYGSGLTLLEVLGHPGAWRIYADLALIGAFGGLFIVPLYAHIQARAPRAQMSRIMAAANIMNAAFMVVASAFGAIALHAGLTVPELLLVTALLNGAVAVYLYCLLPEFLLRFLALLVVRVLYHLRSRGVENIPETGAALLVCNHVSYVDALVMSAACPRPIRFVMEAEIYRLPLLNAICRGMKAIPVATRSEDPAVREAAFAAVAAALGAGELVCIFPEGALTRDGEVAGFRPGILRVLKETPVPVIPCALSNLWGSLFSRREPNWVKRQPRRLFAGIAFSAGAPLGPAAIDLAALREQVVALRGDQR
jgi:1-acyl-sn-glycerol-3-phosphate acyltransferase